MPYTVLLLEDAVKDIEAIYRHYRKSGSEKVAKDNAEGAYPEFL